MHKLQGLFIFVLHVMIHEKVYAKIKGKISNIMNWVSKYIFISLNCVCMYACVRTHVCDMTLRVS